MPAPMDFIHRLRFEDLPAEVVEGTLARYREFLSKVTR